MITQNRDADESANVAGVPCARYEEFSVGDRLRSYFGSLEFYSDKTAMRLWEILSADADERDRATA